VEGTQTPEQRIGVEIRDRRAALGLSQQALADAMRSLGYTWLQTTVAKTEAAERPIRVNELTDLARVLGVSVSDLLNPVTQSELEFSGALAQLFNTMRAVRNLEQHLEELHLESKRTAEDLKSVQQLEREAKARLAAMGAVEVDGRWTLANGGPDA
jgi:transcriptional regulator with XRE-family HTH domain